MGILDLSLPPPALAKSGLPPPPFPPSISDTFFTISTALIFDKRSSVTPTTIEIFFSCTPNKIIIPLFISIFNLSKSFGKSFGGKSIIVLK